MSAFISIDTTLLDANGEGGPGRVDRGEERVVSMSFYGAATRGRLFLLSSQ
jgi:hypothetical protein